MNLHELASAILFLNQQPISRVRFSRTIYFVHKELIRKKLMRAEDIPYVRLPLGPVPEGFTALALGNTNISVRPIHSPGLSYEAEEFIFTADQALQGEPDHQEAIRRAISKTLIALSTHPTSELVAASHDLSWRTHANGERYFLTSADLKNTFPFTPILLRIRLKRPVNNEIGLLQATLLRGMLNDIVRESTDLEYPDDNKPAQEGTTKSGDQSAKGTKVSGQ